MVDTATRFGAERMLKEERGSDVVRAKERAWIRRYGPPQRLLFDEARVERRHLTKRTAVETYLDDLQPESTLENVRELVARVVAAVISLGFTR